MTANKPSWAVERIRDAPARQEIEPGSPAGVPVEIPDFLKILPAPDSPKPGNHSARSRNPAQTSPFPPPATAETPLASSQTNTAGGSPPFCGFAISPIPFGIPWEQRDPRADSLLQMNAKDVACSIC